MALSISNLAKLLAPGIAYYWEEPVTVTHDFDTDALIIVGTYSGIRLGITREILEDLDVSEIIRLTQHAKKHPMSLGRIAEELWPFLRQLLPHVITRIDYHTNSLVFEHYGLSIRCSKEWILKSSGPKHAAHMIYQEFNVMTKQMLDLENDLDALAMEVNKPMKLPKSYYAYDDLYLGKIYKYDPPPKVEELAPIIDDPEAFGYVKVSEDSCCG